MHIPVKTPKQLRHEKGLFTVVEVARKIGVSREVIDYHAKHGRCVAPTVQINELPRRYYTTQDATELAEYFAGEMMDLKAGRILCLATTREIHNK